MKKKYVILTLIIIILLVTTFTYFSTLKQNNIYKEESIKLTKITKGISMNLEQTAGAGDYKTVTQSGWPTDGYQLNTELSRCENGSTLSWDDTKKVVIVSGNMSDKCYVYFDINQQTLSEYVISQYTGTQGDNALYYHTSTLANGAGDNSYRYAGANNSVNNYICLGSDEATCPDANLFRIIGVFGDQVKVIRATSESSQEWDEGGSNTWSTSSLNTYLNGTYLTSLGDLSGKIAIATWKVGGNTAANIGKTTPSVAYTNEMVTQTENTTYDAKIGLMYVSDYGFAASPDAWTLVMDKYNDTVATSNNWMYMGLVEWTISRNSAISNMAFLLKSEGQVGSDRVYVNGVARPVFNLLSSTTYVSGDGTKNSPIRIN